MAVACGRGPLRISAPAGMLSIMDCTRASTTTRAVPMREALADPAALRVYVLVGRISPVRGDEVKKKPPARSARAAFSTR